MFVPAGTPGVHPSSLKQDIHWAPIKPPRGQTLRSPRPKRSGSHSDPDHCDLYADCQVDQAWLSPRKMLTWSSQLLSLSLGAGVDVLFSIGVAGGAC